ncbi:hypothetical protein [Pseudarthrobacter siccitolerans]
MANHWIIEWLRSTPVVGAGGAFRRKVPARAGAVRGDPRLRCASGRRPGTLPEFTVAPHAW